MINSPCSRKSLFLRLLKEYFFILSLLIAVAVGWAWPEPAVGLAKFRHLLLFAVMFLVGLEQKLPELARQFKKFHQVLLSLALSFILFPILSWFFGRLVCFVGGTALRILHDLKRFSEDLDFSARYSAPKKTDFPHLIQTLQLKLATMDLHAKPLKIKSRGAVIATFFSFPNLLHSLNPKAFRKGQLVSIRLDIDTNPPKGAHERSSTVSSSYLYSVRHYTLPSLFAGKLHAVLSRTYTKGRDLYDFLWYSSHAIQANRKLLENALHQTKKEKVTLSDSSLQEMLKQRANDLDFKQARKDVSHFLADPREESLIKLELFLAQIPKVRLTDE